LYRKNIDLVNATAIFCTSAQVISGKVANQLTSKTTQRMNLFFLLTFCNYFIAFLFVVCSDMDDFLSVQDHYAHKDKHLPFMEYAVITMCFTGHPSSARVKLGYNTNCPHPFNTTGFVVVFDLEQFSTTYEYTPYSSIILGFFFFNFLIFVLALNKKAHSFSATQSHGNFVLFSVNTKEKIEVCIILFFSSILCNCFNRKDKKNLMFLSLCTHICYRYSEV
jgi:hypothetical protein